MKHMNTRNIAWQNGILGLALLGGVAQAREDDEITGEGTVTLISKEILSMHKEDDTTIATVHITARVDGLLQGTIDSNETANVHADGSIDVTACETFTGSVNGTPGTLELRERSVIDAAGNISGSFVIVDSGGDLAGWSGHGSLRGANETNTYRITLRGE
jgi:hypothetical protein